MFVATCLICAVQSFVVTSPAPPGLFNAQAPARIRLPMAQAPAPAAQAEAAAKVYPLHDEAASGDVNAVELLLLGGLSCDERNARGSTALHIAAVKGHKAVVSALLDHGACPNVPNAIGNTPLHAAVECGQLECARLLVARGADAGAEGENDITPLRTAAIQGNPEMLSALLSAGAKMDEETAEVAFWAAVQLAESVAPTVPSEVGEEPVAAEAGTLSPAVPALLHHVFDADMEQLLGRGKQTTNVTCLQPTEDAPKVRAEDDPGYGVINDDLLAVPLREGRACAGGVCCESCSRVHFPSLVTPREVDAFLQELQYAIVPPLHQFSLAKCAFRDMRTTLIFVRLVERMRRAIAHEYGLKLSTVTPLQTFVACFSGAQDKQGGLHSDESTFKEFHYSCVLYLTTQGEDFTGGTFMYNDRPEAHGQPSGSPRVVTPLAPKKGSAVIFSSGWENMHEVEPLESGTRYAVPSFFTTRPEPEEYAMWTAEKDLADIADEMWRTLLAPDTSEGPKFFMDKWHCLLAPGR